MSAPEINNVLEFKQHQQRGAVEQMQVPHILNQKESFMGVKQPVLQLKTATSADMADLLFVHINVLSALEAIAREFPQECGARKQLDLSRQGMTEALGSIVRRHQMEIVING